ncbi:MAG TPA: hypothetical protein VFV96_05500 [Verrucomicrobiae bacterium]|nr:hypothetical protein [Verrucomicrobiae bacterium]
MSALAYTEDQLVEQPVIDGAVLESRGWAARLRTIESELPIDVGEY